ncbi:MAG: minor capsid protein [Butyrivibrio sp.]|nr:minor capsid protein [Acetatifactor muris]MCM1561169.1 minor capsid protein [Butyrivibrio sp.]
MAYTFVCTFNLGDCIKTLGLEERGRIQQFVANEVLRLSDPYVPLAKGGLMGSGHTEDGTDIVWDLPYAHYMWEGIVYEDPKLHCAGFKTENGWRSRKDVEKVPTDRKLQYGNGNLRGSHWAERMLQDGGRKEIEDKARREVGK